MRMERETLQQQKAPRTGHFLPGNSAHKPGQRHHVPQAIREAILEAAHRLGSDGKGKGSVVGFLMQVGTKKPEVLAALLGRLVPFAVERQPDSSRFRTSEEVAAEMRHRGLS